MCKIKSLQRPLYIMFNVHSNAVESEVKSMVTEAELLRFQSYLQYLLVLGLRPHSLTSLHLSVLLQKMGITMLSTSYFIDCRMLRALPNS